MTDLTLTFDADRHVYAIGGNPVPSVTQIIRAVIPRQWNADPWCMQRGTMVHKAAALLLRGQLDWTTVDERILPRVRAVEKFWLQNQVELTGPTSSAYAMWVEELGCNPVFGYAGTPDLRIGSVIVDWKSCDEPEAEIQGGGYACMFRPGQIRTFMSVELKEDETYRVTKYDAKRCSGLFMNVLTVYQWMVKHGRVK